MSRIRTKSSYLQSPEGAVENFCRALGIALKQFVIGFDHAARRIEQAFTIGVFADVSQQRFRGSFSLGARRTDNARIDGRGHVIGRQEFRIFPPACHCGSA
jgi:hypothetical protein